MTRDHHDGKVGRGGAELRPEIALAVEGAAPAKPEEKKETASAGQPAAPAAQGGPERIAGATGQVRKLGNITGGRGGTAPGEAMTEIQVQFAPGGGASMNAKVVGVTTTLSTFSETGTWRLQGESLCVALGQVGGSGCYSIAFAGNCFTLSGAGVLSSLRACK